LGYEVHGLDFEPGRLASAKYLANNYGQKPTFENKSFTEFDGNKTFDIVLLGEVLEHFEDPISILKKIKGLLKGTGRVVVTVPNMPSLRNRLKFGLFGIFPDNNPEHKYYFDFKRFRKVANEAGFKVSYWRTSFTYIFHTSKLSSLFQRVLLFWFVFLFPKSGDILFAVLSPKIAAYEK
jgi:2-polyprenyl-3-methyl-5-hydroxy-6-metoxy-1,4-benzoquinol methylase